MTGRRRSPRTDELGTDGVRAELANLRRGLDRVEAALAQTGVSSQASVTTRSRPERYYRLLVDVYERGRHGLDGTTFASLGRNRGYDARGLGGFFVGSRAPLLRRRERVVLTPEGHQLVDRYLRGIGR